MAVCLPTANQRTGLTSGTIVMMSTHKAIVAPAALLLTIWTNAITHTISKIKGIESRVTRAICFPVFLMNVSKATHRLDSCVGTRLL